MLSSESIYSLSALESKLVSYISDADALDEPFDASEIPKISKEQAAKDAAREYTQPMLYSMCLTSGRSEYSGDDWCPIIIQSRYPSASFCGGGAIKLCSAARRSS